MRLKRDKVQEIFLKKRIITKDEEGGTIENFGDAVSFKGIPWDGGGNMQAAIYGEQLKYMKNIKVDGKYGFHREGGHLRYVLANGAVLMEKDGICLNVSKDEAPDYQIEAIRPYEHLQLEVKQIDRGTGQTQSAD